MEKEKNFILIDYIENLQVYFKNMKEMENCFNFIKNVRDKKANIETNTRIIKTLSNKVIIEINKKGVEV